MCAIGVTTMRVSKCEVFSDVANCTYVHSLFLFLSLSLSVSLSLSSLSPLSLSLSLSSLSPSFSLSRGLYA